MTDTKKKALSIGQIVLNSAAVVALVTAAPQLFDKIMAWNDNKTIAQMEIDRRNARLWEQHAGCVKQKYIQIHDDENDSTMHLRVCAPGLVMIENVISKTKSHYDWIVIDKKYDLSATRIMNFFELDAQQFRVIPPNSNYSIQEKLPVLICSRNVGGMLISFYREGDQCYSEAIIFATGETVKNQVSCNPTPRCD